MRRFDLFTCLSVFWTGALNAKSEVSGRCDGFAESIKCCKTVLKISAKSNGFLPVGFFPLCELQLPSLQFQGAAKDQNFLFPCIIQSVKSIRSDKWFGDPALLGGEFRGLRGLFFQRLNEQVFRAPF